MVKSGKRRWSGRGARTTAAALCIAVLGAARAHATYSIIAVDLDTGQVGGVGTSCVGSQLSVSEIYAAAPGFGVVVAQAALNSAGRDRAVMLLAQGEAAPDVLAEITAPSFDFVAAIRQYAVIDASGAAAGFTGDSTMAYADDVQGRAGNVVYSAQGNILTGAAVLEQAAAVFDAPGCDLADTLMRALEAGAHDGAGDSRCTPDGIPSDGAFIEVNLPGDGANSAYLHLQVDDTRPQSPLVELRQLFDAWRADHPCPDPPVGMPAIDAGIGAGIDAGAADASSPPSEPPPGLNAGSAAPAPAGSAGVAPAAAGASGAGMAAGGGAAAANTTSSSPSAGGCSLSPHDRAPRAAPALAVFAAALLAARATRAARRARRRITDYLRI